MKKYVYASIENGKVLNKDEFMSYMVYEFPTSLSMDSFSYDMLDNIVDYGRQKFSNQTDKYINYLLDMIPEVEREEIEQFFE